MMRRFFVGFLFFLFLLQGSVFQLLLPQAWGSPFVVVPQLVLNAIVVLSLYLHERDGLLFGFVFGLLHDLVYGPALGISAFTTALVAYVTALVGKQFPPSLWIAGMTATLAQFSYLFIIYSWYRLFDFTQMPFLPAFTTHIVPSIIFNVSFGYPIYWWVSRIYQKHRPHTIQLFS